MPASTRRRVALEKLIAKGLSVEEIVRLELEVLESESGFGFGLGSADEMIQLKGAWAFDGEVA